MKPVHQTTFGEHTGNRFQAVLASIFEIDIGQIPYFQAHKSAWYGKFSDWMIEQYGLQPVDLEITDNPAWLWIPRGYHVISGLSPRGDYYHSVVGECGKMVHDPHPSGDGLRTWESFTVFVAVNEVHFKPTNDCAND